MRCLEGVLMGTWKLHFEHDYPSAVTPGRDGARGTTTELIPLSLFDLTSDPGETENVVDQFAERVQQMMALAKAHQQELEAARREPGYL